MGQCPPGVICIENFTLLIVIIIGIAVFYYIHSTNQNISNNIFSRGLKHPRRITQNITENVNEIGLYPRYNYSNVEDDVLLNPYEPPLRDDRIFKNFNAGRRSRGVPINISTQAADAEYRQIGILTRMNGQEMILPLLGKPLFSNRDKWNFYTMSDKNNMIKLPVTHKGKSCTNEYGCDNLYNGDTVYVEGYNDAFKVTVYDNQVMKYLPFL